jgi:hypothetical protein
MSNQYINKRDLNKIENRFQKIKEILEEEEEVKTQEGQISSNQEKFLLLKSKISRIKSIFVEGLDKYLIDSKAEVEKEEVEDDEEDSEEDEESEDEEEDSDSDSEAEIAEDSEADNVWECCGEDFELYHSCTRCKSWWCCEYVHDSDDKTCHECGGKKKSSN